MTTTPNPIIIAVMTIPLETRNHTETVHMVLTQGLYWEALTESLLGARLSKNEVAELTGPTGRNERYALGISNARAVWVYDAGDMLIKAANNPADITGMNEYYLQECGVTLLRIPRLVTESSVFHTVVDGWEKAKTYEEYTGFEHGAWACDRLSQDFEAEFEIKEPGDTGVDLLDLMTLWAWYKGMDAMSARLGYPLNIETGEGYLW